MQLCDISFVVLKDCKRYCLTLLLPLKIELWKVSNFLPLVFFQAQTRQIFASVDSYLES